MKEGKKERAVYRVAKFWAGAAIAAFLAAAAIYLVLLQTEKTMLEGYEKGDVYLVQKDLPAGLVLTEANTSEYIVPASVDASLIPEKAVRELAELYEHVVVGDVDAGVVLTEGMFQEVNALVEGMEEPVIAGFRAEDLCQVVGGVLRAGDRIHIYCSDEGIGTFLIWENVYVQQVFDSGGTVIESGDRETAAQRINIFLDKRDVESFYTRLEQGNLLVVKIW